MARGAFFGAPRPKISRSVECCGGRWRLPVARGLAGHDQHWSARDRMALRFSASRFRRSSSRGGLRRRKVARRSHCHAARCLATFQCPQDCPALGQRDGGRTLGLRRCFWPHSTLVVRTLLVILERLVVAAAVHGALDAGLPGCVEFEARWVSKAGCRLPGCSMTTTCRCIVESTHRCRQ